MTMHVCRMSLCVTLFLYLGGAKTIAGDELSVLRKQIKSPDRTARFIAIGKIGQLGEKGKDAVLDLLAVLEADDPSLKAVAARAIGQIGPSARQAVPSLIRALKQDEEAVVEGAITALGGIGPAAEEAIPSLIGFLRASNRNLKRRAVESIGEIGKISLDGEKLLLEIAKDHSFLDEVIVALGRLGKKGVEAEEVYFKGLTSRKDYTRYQALEAMFRTKSYSERLMGEATKRIGTDSWSEKVIIARILQESYPPKKSAPYFVVLLGDDHPTVLYATIKAVAHVRASTPEIISALEKCAMHPNPEIRRVAEMALESLRKK